jgi:nicotinate phosphoribosyltransferase
LEDDDVDRLPRPELQVPLFKGGVQVYHRLPHGDPSLPLFRRWTLLDQYKRNLNPHIYKVDLSDGLWMLKQSMLKNKAGQNI